MNPYFLLSGLCCFADGLILDQYRAWCPFFVFTTRKDMAAFNQAYVHVYLLTSYLFWYEKQKMKRQIHTSVTPVYLIWSWLVGWFVPWTFWITFAFFLCKLDFRSLRYKENFTYKNAAEDSLSMSTLKRHFKIAYRADGGALHGEFIEWFEWCSGIDIVMKKEQGSNSVGEFYVPFC